MKKIVISLLIAIGAFSMAHAQVKPSFGFKAGLNFPKLSGSDIDAKESTGFHAGAVLHIPIKKFGFMAEALYSKEGSENIELNYIDLPIMVTYKLVPGLRLHLGPQFKFKADAKVDLGSPGGLDLSADEKSIEDDINDLNFDGVVGMEYKFPVIGLFAQARYVFGLGDIGDTEAKATQNIFQLSVGYRF